MERSMSERYMRAAGESIRMRGPVVDRAMDAFGDEFKEKGWPVIPEVAKYFLRALNVEPSFENSQDREKLLTEPGIAIANHPGYVDAAIIVSMMERPDVKVMAYERLYEGLREAMVEKFGEAFTETFFAEHLISTKKNPNTKDELKAVHEAVDLINEHIQSGGLFFAFPGGGGTEERSGAHVRFRPILRKVLEKLSPETMVYGVNFDTEDVKSMSTSWETIKRMPGLARNLYLRKPEDVKLGDSPTSIKVKEKYTQASEWQEAIGSQTKHTDQDQALTDHYWEQFK